MNKADLKFLLAVLAPLALSLALFFATAKSDDAGISASRAPDHIPRIADIEKQAEAAWEQACLITQADCPRMERPRVVFEPMNGWGYYRYFVFPGSQAKCTDTIYVDESVKGQVFAKYIMVHEYTHAIQCELGWMSKDSPALRSNCERERVAFQVEGIAAHMDKFSDPRVDTWEEIKWAYSCQ